MAQAEPESLQEEDGRGTQALALDVETQAGAADVAGAAAVLAADDAVAVELLALQVAAAGPGVRLAPREGGADARRVLNS